MKYELDYTDLSNLTIQIREYFFLFLQKTVEEELDHRAYRSYFDHFYKTGFYKDFDLRTDQLARKLYDSYLSESSVELSSVADMLQVNFRSFTAHFIIRHCKPLHKMALPEAMLRYQGVRVDPAGLPRMIFDFLDFDQEPEKVYTDLTGMSKSKLKNAGKAFLFTAPEEKIFFICDQTLFGSCTEGFAMTTRALYWKSHFNPPGKVVYQDIDTIKRDSEWLLINNLFFNVSRSVNYKMMKLLQKIRTLNENGRINSEG